MSPHYTGEIAVDPPLSTVERKYLRTFASTPRWIAAVRMRALPSAAYDFTHPDPIGNVPLDQVHSNMLTDVRLASDGQCRLTRWQPVECCRPVTWPRPEPAIPPLEDRFGALITVASHAGLLPCHHEPWQREFS